MTFQMLKIKAELLNDAKKSISRTANTQLTIALKKESEGDFEKAEKYLDNAVKAELDTE